jgi:hypothetical protein
MHRGKKINDYDAKYSYVNLILKLCISFEVICYRFATFAVNIQALINMHPDEYLLLTAKF